MIALRGLRGATGKEPWDDHQAFGPYLLRVLGMSHSGAGIDRTCANDDGYASFGQGGYTGLALVIGEQRPIAHGTTVDHSVHAGRDEVLAFFHQARRVWPVIGVGGRH